MKQTIVGVVFISMWILVLVLWGSFKNTKADFSNDDRNQTEIPCRVGGHPLWTDC